MVDLVIQRYLGLFPQRVEGAVKECSPCGGASFLPDRLDVAQPCYEQDRHKFVVGHVPLIVVVSADGAEKFALCLFPYLVDLHHFGSDQDSRLEAISSVGQEREALLSDSVGSSLADQLGSVGVHDVAHGFQYRVDVVHGRIVELQENVQCIDSRFVLQFGKALDERFGCPVLRLATFGSSTLWNSSRDWMRSLRLCSRSMRGKRGDLPRCAGSAA